MPATSRCLVCQRGGSITHHGAGYHNYPNTLGARPGQGQVVRLLAILVLLLLVAACSPGETTSRIPNGSIIPTTKRIVIDQISGENLLNPNREISTGDYRGNVVVINVWGSWRGPCRSEIPDIEQVYQQTNKMAVGFLGINIRDHVRGYAEDFVKDRSVSYSSIYDPAARSLLNLKKYRNIAVPTTFILDRGHRVAAVFIGAVNIDDLVPRIREIATERD